MGRDDLLQAALICAGAVVTVGTALGFLCVWHRLAVLDGSIVELTEIVNAQSRVIEQLSLGIKDALKEQEAEEEAWAKCKKHGISKYADSEDSLFSRSRSRGYDYWPYSQDSLYSGSHDYYSRRRYDGVGSIQSYDSLRGSLTSYDRRYDYGSDYDSYDYYDRYDDDYGYGRYYGSYSNRALTSQDRKQLERQFRNRTRTLERDLWWNKSAKAPRPGLRRSTNGSVMNAPDKGCPWVIPQVLHQTWKTSEVPSKFTEYLKSWRRTHRHWRFEFWDDRRSRELVAEHFPKYLRDYDRMSGIKRADVFRLVALYVQGGVYADIDVEVVNSFDPLLEAARKARQGVLLGEENFVHSVLLEHRSTWLVSNAVMASAAGHQFWLDVLKEIFSNTWCGDDPVQCTGPRLVDRLSWEYLRRSPGCGVHGCIARLPFTYFSPDIARWNVKNMVRGCSQGTSTWSRKGRKRLVNRACRGLENSVAYPAALRTDRTFAVHHWQCSWCRQDDTLRGTIRMEEVIWQLGNETLSRRRRRSKNPR